MTIKNQLVSVLTGLTVLFSSCSKDVLTENESLNAETVSSNATADDVVETAPATYTSVVTNVNSNVAGFWQAIPARYSLTTKKYPLIIFIHGIGELGTNLTTGTMNCCGLPYHLKKQTFPANFNIGGKNYSFIVMAPQFKVRPSAADVQAMIAYMKSKYRIDETRVYVTGLSMGGGSTWDFSGVYGQNAAAIVPVCGGTGPSDALCKNIGSKNLAVWALYGARDAIIPSSWANTFMTLIDKYNPSYASKTKSTIWSDTDHNQTWQRAFNPNTRVDGYNIYEWMLLNQRGTATAPAPTPTPEPTPAPTPTPTTGNVAPVANAGADQSIPKSWNYLRLNGLGSKDPDGWIVSVRWSQVSGPNTLTLETPLSGNTLVHGMIAGTYVWKVAVTDNKGAVSYDTTTITITNN